MNDLFYCIVFRIEIQSDKIYLRTKIEKRTREKKKIIKIEQNEEERGLYLYMEY